MTPAQDPKREVVHVQTSLGRNLISSVYCPNEVLVLPGIPDDMKIGHRPTATPVRDHGNIKSIPCLGDHDTQNYGRLRNILMDRNERRFRKMTISNMRLADIRI